MCLMIVKPEGKDVSDEHLENGFENNPDGGGYCWVDGGKVYYRKGIFDFNEFKTSYRQDVGERPAIIHFRMATHGGVNHENCHPFDIGNGAMMAHNGVIQIATKQGESDTRAFLRERLAPVLVPNPDAIQDASWIEQIDAAIGGSKLGFLYPNGRHYIIGEKRGEWENGVWFSNSGHKYSHSACYAAYGYGAGNRHGSWHGGWPDGDQDERSYWEDVSRVDGAMTPAEAQMDDPEIMDTNDLACDICGSPIHGEFTIDRRSCVLACSSCVSTKKTYKWLM